MTSRRLLLFGSHMQNIHRALDCILACIWTHADLLILSVNTLCCLQFHSLTYTHIHTHIHTHTQTHLLTLSFFYTHTHTWPLPPYEDMLERMLNTYKADIFHIMLPSLNNSLKRTYFGHTLPCMCMFEYVCVCVCVCVCVFPMLWSWPYGACV